MSGQKSIREILEDARRVGTLGQRPIDEVIAHARLFVVAIPPGSQKIIDIGSGAGVPGLVIAEDRPDCTVTMVDRRATRMDALTRGVAATGLSSRAHVLTADVESLGKSDEHVGAYDVVVSRGFGPPDVTATLARPLLRDGGLLLVSEPPTPDPSRWPENLTSRLGFDPPVFTTGISILRAKPLFSGDEQCFT